MNHSKRKPHRIGPTNDPTPTCSSNVTITSHMHQPGKSHVFVCCLPISSYIFSSNFSMSMHIYIYIYIYTHTHHYTSSGFIFAIMIYYIYTPIIIINMEEDLLSHIFAINLSLLYITNGFDYSLVFLVIFMLDVL